MTIGNDFNGLSPGINDFDVSGLAALKRQAKSGDPAANKEVARQFEALFLQMVMKSMRDATPRDGLFNSDQTRLYESLLDQQMGRVLSTGNRGTGLAAMIEAQLVRRNQEIEPFDGPLPLSRPATMIPLPQAKNLSSPLGPASSAHP